MATKLEGGEALTSLTIYNDSINHLAKVKSFDGMLFSLNIQLLLINEIKVLKVIYVHLFQAQDQTDGVIRSFRYYK